MFSLKGSINNALDTGFLKFLNFHNTIFSTLFIFILSIIKFQFFTSLANKGYVEVQAFWKVMLAKF
jgi:hypothetical protein